MNSDVFRENILSSSHILVNSRLSWHEKAFLALRCEEILHVLVCDAEVSYVIESAFRCDRATNNNSDSYEVVKFEIVVFLFFHDVKLAQWTH